MVSVGRLHVDVEVGAGEAEDDARLVLGEEHGIDDQPISVSDEGDHQGEEAPAPADAADEIGALVAVEDGVEQVHAFNRLGAPGIRAMAVDGIRDRRRVEDYGLVRHAPVPEQARDERGRARRRRIGCEGRSGRRRAGPVVLRVHELHRRVHAHGGEEAPGHRVEEGLGELVVGAVFHRLEVEALRRRPHGPAGRAQAQLVAELGDGARDEPAVKVEPVTGVLLYPLPLAALVAHGGPAGDLPKLAQVGLVGALDHHRAPGGHARMLGAHRRATRRGDGWPTWMWAPEVWPGTVPQAAMKGIPLVRR